MLLGAKLVQRSRRPVDPCCSGRAAGARLEPIDVAPVASARAGCTLGAPRRVIRTTWDRRRRTVDHRADTEACLRRG